VLRGNINSGEENYESWSKGSRSGKTHKKRNENARASDQRERRCLVINPKEKVESMGTGLSPLMKCEKKGSEPKGRRQELPFCAGIWNKREGSKFRTEKKKKSTKKEKQKSLKRRTKKSNFFDEKKNKKRGALDIERRKAGR